jgi:hypothetical protein
VRLRWPTRRQWRGIFAAVVVLGFAGALVTYNRFFRESDPPLFRSDEDHFLFGSIGTEANEGVPYWIWLVLPRVFPDLLPGPGGYASLGLVSRGGAEMPIGLSKVTVGFPRVGINCAFCHTASYRLRADDPPVLVPAGPSHQTAPQAYFRFLFAAASDPRFNASAIMGEIAKNTRLPLMDRLLMRFALIPGTRRALRRARDEQDTWMRTRPDWGPGRIDPFNPVKFRMLGLPVDGTIGNSDMVPVWNIRRRAGWAYHWDGLSDSLREVVISSALGDGASTTWVDRDMARWDNTEPGTKSSLRRVTDYMLASSAPRFPVPVDTALASQGATIYQAQCAACHTTAGPRAGTIVPVDEVGTDRHRLDMWTKAAAAAYNAYGEGHTWDFSGFRSTTGYVPPLHDGLWLRGPYLHNGSVPTLADLLSPPAERPARFWRGYDVIDAVRVGFVSTGPEAERVGVAYDTSAPGNSNAGHAYGTTLSADEKRALLEYLKTL